LQDATPRRKTCSSIRRWSAVPLIYPTAADLHAHTGEFRYARYGTPTTKALQQALMAIEGPHCAGRSGLSAISSTLLAVFLAMRGLRTLSVRLAQHQRSALDIARWLETRPDVIGVLYPALESDPGHAIWKRDFSGASGLFAIILKPAPRQAVDALTLFGMGYSWGGFEGLIPPFDCDVTAQRLNGRPTDRPCVCILAWRMSRI
jgi:cystathionine beta-lyase/cystathionine gamma-synthase